MGILLRPLGFKLEVQFVSKDMDVVGFVNRVSIIIS